jgi:hypothetical protein
LLGLSGDIVEMAVVLIEKDFYGLCHIFFCDRFRGFRLDINGEDRSQPIYQPGLAGGFRIDRVDSFVGKRLIGFRARLCVKISNVFERKRRHLDLVGYIKRGNSSDNQLGDVADSHQPHRVQGFVLVLFVLLIQFPQGGQKIFQFISGNAIKFINENDDLFLFYNSVQLIKQLTKGYMIG